LIKSRDLFEIFVKSGIYLKVSYRVRD
jgi:hypothetical protein